MDTVPHRRYTIYLRWHARVTTLMTGLYGIPALFYSHPQTYWLAVTCTISACFAGVAWALNRFQHLRASLFVLYVQLLALPIVFALILPFMYPVVAYVPVLVIAITLPLLSTRTLIWSMVACGISTVLTVLVGVFQPIFTTTLFTGTALNLIVVLSYGMVSLLTYVMLWLYKRHLQQALDQLATTNTELEQERMILEEKVEQRTAELQQTLAYLDAANESLRDLALRDQLTGLFNRRYADETLEIEIYRARRSGLPIGVMLIDLDHFKQVNDTYGHDAGDALLQAVATLLEDHVRSGDIVARHGGEEFFMMLPGIPLPPLEQRGEMIREAIRGLQVTHNGQDLGMRSCSIGIAAYPAHGSDSTGLIKAADQALYQAKAAGRDRVVVADEAVAPLDAEVWPLLSFDQPPS